MRMPLFAALESYHAAPAHSAAMNMAIDEALFEMATTPSIRFYRWNSPALSFGYFGRFADVADYTAERDLVRRWTGGGIVLHGDDLTYSIVIPPGDPVFGESSMSIYEKIHRALAQALAANGRHAELACVRANNDRGELWGAHASSRAAIGALADRPRRNAEDLREAPKSACEGACAARMCFANPVHADVMVNGCKIAGAAQRRTRAGLLQQGSIQGVDLGNGLAERFATALSNNCESRNLPKIVQHRARELAARKYGTESWLRRR